MSNQTWTATWSGPLLTYGVPVVCPLGVVMNALVFAVSRQGDNRFSSCYAYMGILALTDLVLLLLTFSHWAALVALDTLPRRACPTLAFLEGSLELLTVAEVVAVTVDRTLAIVRPLSGFSWRTPRRAGVICLLLATACLALSLPSVFLHGQRYDVSCFLAAAPTSLSRGLAWAGTTVKHYLPLLTLLLLDTIITRRAFLCPQCSCSIRRSSSGTSANTRCVSRTVYWTQAGITREDRSQAALVVVMNIVFGLLRLPDAVHFTLRVLVPPANSNRLLDPVHLQLAELGRLLASAAKFLVYIIASASFRADVRQIASVLSSWCYYVFYVRRWTRNRTWWTKVDVNRDDLPGYDNSLTTRALFEIHLNVLSTNRNPLSNLLARDKNVFCQKVHFNTEIVKHLNDPLTVIP